MVAEVDDQPAEVGGQGGLDVDVLAGQGMDEAERLGVERLAVEVGLGARLVAGAVDGVADDRMADLGQVDADLVGPAGLEPAGDEGGHRAEPLDDAVMGDAVPPLAAAAGDAAAEVAAVGDQGQVDRPLAPGGVPSTTARYCRSMSCA